METNLTPYTAVELLPAESVLVFAPHPDDEAIGCGGLLARYAQHKIPVDVVFLTSGEFGEHGKVGAETREEESRAACQSLSVRAVNWWKEPDRGVKYHERTIEQAVAAVKQSGVDLLLCPSINEIHPDHRNTAWIAIEAARRLIAQGYIISVGMYEVGAPLHFVNALVDITPVVDDKRRAIKCYTSQLDLYSYDELIIGLNQFRSYTLDNSVKYAEAYRLLTAEELRQPALLAEPEVRRQERLNLVSIKADCDKVSILIRSMGRDSLIRALDSVALQTWPNIEVLVLNARGPGHPPVPAAAGSFPVRFLDGPDGFQRSAAANELLQQADSQFALFLDDDDWLAPDHISTLMHALQQAPAAIAATSGVELGVLEDNVWQSEHVFNDRFDRQRLLFENYLPIHSVLFRLREVRDKFHCQFDTDLQVFEDWDFWLQCSRHADMVSTDHVSAYYCQNANDGSDVFSASESNKAQLEQLRGKWFAALDNREFGDLLQYTQQQYRDRGLVEARLEEELQRCEQLRLEMAGLMEIMSAREQEIANFNQHVAGLNQHVANMEDMLKDKDAYIEELDAALQSVRSALGNLQAASARRLWLLQKMIKPNK